MKPSRMRAVAIWGLVGLPLFALPALLGIWAQIAEAGQPYSCNPNCNYGENIGFFVGLWVFVLLGLGMVFGSLCQEAVHQAGLREPRPPRNDRAIALLQEAVKELDSR